MRELTAKNTSITNVTKVPLTCPCGGDMVSGQIRCPAFPVIYHAIKCIKCGKVYTALD